MHVVLLPGLDGTGDTFAPLTRVGFGDQPHTIISYPTDRQQSYNENLALAREAVDGLSGPAVVVAESYSGPIGVRLAADPPANLAGVILVATFVTSPVPGWLDRFAAPVFFRRSPPRAVVRHFLAGWRSPRSVADTVINATEKVAPDVFRHRVLSILAVDVRAELRTASVPLLYIKPTRDRLVRTTRRSLLAHQPALEWAEVNAPHLVLQTQPQESSRIICEFAESI